MNINDIIVYIKLIMEAYMKVERLMNILIYLLNNDCVSAKKLSDKFNVSVRTIQRDIASLENSGIPIISYSGVNGGYGIMPQYKLNNTLNSYQDSKYIIMALDALNSSYNNNKLSNLIEKYKTFYKEKSNSSPSNIFFDYSISKEDRNVQLNNKILEEAILNRQIVTLNYTSASNKKSSKKIEPLALQYKWYAWYLLAYDLNKSIYRTYKVARMQNLIVLEKTSHIEHENIETLLKSEEEKYFDTCIDIKVLFKKNEEHLIQEYFPNEKRYIDKDGNSILLLSVPPRERLWKALLLSFGDSIQILSPESYKNELIETANKFLSNYDI